MTGPLTGGIRAMAAVAFCTMLTGCNGSWQSALDTHGQAADRLKILILIFVVVCGSIWLMVVAVLLLAIRRARLPATRVRPASESRTTIVVISAVTATVVVISGLTGLSFVTTRALPAAGPDEMLIRIRGMQWWWDVSYLDSDGQGSFATANEIHVPVGRPVRLKLEGGDVIHSFWVPSLAGKQDLIPGRANELVFRADRAGVYRGQCAEYCGMQHAHMGFVVFADPPDDYRRWLDGQRAGARPSANDEEKAGEQAFMKRPCAACHAVRGTAAAGSNGPDLTHVGSRAFIAAGLLPVTRGSIAAWTADPQTIKPGNNMPLVPISPDELRAISAWLASLR